MKPPAEAPVRLAEMKSDRHRFDEDFVIDAVHVQEDLGIFTSALSGLLDLLMGFIGCNPRNERGQATGSLIMD